MTILNRKLGVGLLILAAVVLVFGAAVAGGIEWAFASLGMIVLMGMTGIGIYTLSKALRRSDMSLKGGVPECGSKSAISFDSDHSKGVTYCKPAKVGIISKEDKRLIMEHIDELFERSGEQNGEKLAEVEPISDEDERLIMEHIDELLEISREESEEKLS